MQLRALERDAKSQRDLLESYLGKYREATARDSIDAASPEARIISRALVSTTPAYPKTLATVLVAALGMFAVSVGWVFSGELLGAIPGPTDLEGKVFTLSATDGGTPAPLAGSENTRPRALDVVNGQVWFTGTASDGSTNDGLWL